MELPRRRVFTRTSFWPRYKPARRAERRGPMWDVERCFALPWSIYSLNDAASSKCEIEHGHIHGDDSDDRHELPAQQHAPAISQRTVNAVAVPRRQHADARRPLGHKRRVVTYSLALRNMAQADNPRTEAHHRLQRQPRFRFFAFFRRIVARMVAIENRSWPHHVRPRLRPRHDGRAVRQVHNSRINPQRAQPLERRVKTLFLFACLLANSGIRENFRGSKVRENPSKLQMFAFPQLPRKALHVAGCNPQPVHSRIDFQMERHALLATAARRRAIQ